MTFETNEQNVMHGIFGVFRRKMSKSLKKIVEESRDKNLPEVEMCDRGISNMLDIPGLCKRITYLHTYETALSFL